MKRIRFVTALLLALLVLFGPSADACAEGNAPLAENLELKTYRGVSVGGKLKAFDPDDGAVSFEISTQPVKGSVELEEDGSFVYTPRARKRGRDYFGYRAVDAEGNCSQEATVIIRIEKQKKKIAYADLQGNACEYAAVALGEEGIFTGERIGDACCFFPERSVSRAEFLAMCLRLTEEEPALSVLRTGYADDDRIPVWVKGCLTAAALAGRGDGREVFEADSAISVGEAAEMLDRFLGLTEIRYLQTNEEQTQACVNLLAHGIPVASASRVLSRADAARMLAAALEQKQ